MVYKTTRWKRWIIEESRMRYIVLMSHNTDNSLRLIRRYIGTLRGVKISLHISILVRALKKKSRNSYYVLIIHIFSYKFNCHWKISLPCYQQLRLAPFIWGLQVICQLGGSQLGLPFWPFVPFLEGFPSFNFV